MPDTLQNKMLTLQNTGYRALQDHIQEHSQGLVFIQISTLLSEQIFTETQARNLSDRKNVI